MVVFVRNFIDVNVKKRPKFFKPPPSNPETNDGRKRPKFFKPPPSNPEPNGRTRQDRQNQKKNPRKKFSARSAENFFRVRRFV